MDKTNIHIPIAISTCGKKFKEIFLIDNEMLKEDSVEAVKQLFRKTFFKHILSRYKDYFM
jgi:hypothetical protein